MNMKRREKVDMKRSVMLKMNKTRTNKRVKPKIKR